MKKREKNKDPDILEEPMLSYQSTDDRTILKIIKLVNKGVTYPVFKFIADLGNFSLQEWARFLHISERTIQRYKKDKKPFDPLYSEKILQIALLNEMGKAVFGSQEKFDLWLNIENLALDKSCPIDFLSNSFGIQLLRDELTRIEHGVLA